MVVDGRLEAACKSVFQDGPLSPLLANTLPNDLDKELGQRNHRFACYVAGFLILVKSKRAGERVMASVSRFLKNRLKLTLKSDKSKGSATGSIASLGFALKRSHIRWSNKAFVRFKQRVRGLTGRNWGVSMAYRLFKLAEYLRGWMGYYGVSEFYRPIPELDHWLRRSVRMCYWKQWRYCRTKVRELTRLGTFLRTAILAGLSRKGPWRLSRTMTTQTGMTNQWLADQGLLSAKGLWVSIHYPATAR